MAERSKRMDCFLTALYFHPDKGIRDKQVSETKWVLIVLGVFIASWIWPTPFIYKTRYGTPWRINRFTGTEQVNVGGYWIKDTSANRSMARNYIKEYKESGEEPVSEYN